MVRVPTLIPESWRDRAAAYWRQSWTDRLWQALIVLVGGTIVVLALTSSVAFVTVIAGIIVSIVLADDIKATVMDVWRRDFWIWKIET